MFIFRRNRRPRASAAQLFTTTIILINISGLFFSSTDAQKCNRTPEGHGAMKTPADGRFHIRIAENTARYTPGLKYTSSYKQNVFNLYVFYIVYVLCCIYKNTFSIFGGNRSWWPTETWFDAAQIFRIHARHRKER